MSKSDALRLSEENTSNGIIFGAVPVPSIMAGFSSEALSRNTVFGADRTVSPARAHPDPIQTLRETAVPNKRDITGVKITLVWHRNDALVDPDPESRPRLSRVKDPQDHTASSNAVTQRGSAVAPPPTGSRSSTFPGVSLIWRRSRDTAEGRKHTAVAQLRNALKASGVGGPSVPYMYFSDTDRVPYRNDTSTRDKRPIRRRDSVGAEVEEEKEAPPQGEGGDAAATAMGGNSFLSTDPPPLISIRDFKTN
eukprot:CAMPEP_0183321042 /NCGR_PEP_ID=MMETSP0160_2-20130417/67908_1 /TAXON_ID=2839 ORGANISM="Odontella Sinensis, Strain Grunow 1884" /NCGR_SAMPLE_ID=MMETSP0160_2 /ASSEMBLY_ACC=CAM_ASM_000250 /LENGTH=250 /DNA_ID=CAMNT_0025487887 /DNA_START=443 /DNA_END=1192 /DNA_ORIENTATION=-